MSRQFLEPLALELTRRADKRFVIKYLRDEDSVCVQFNRWFKIMHIHLYLESNGMMKVTCNPKHDDPYEPKSFLYDLNSPDADPLMLVLEFLEENVKMNILKKMWKSLFVMLVKSSEIFDTSVFKCHVR
jgi:hypothetical protein